MKTLFSLLFVFAAAAAAWLWWRDPAPVAEPPGPADALPVSVPSPSTPSVSEKPAPVSAPPKASLPLLVTPEEIRQHLLSGDPRLRDRVVGELLPALIAHDPFAAARLVETWPPGPLRDELLRQAARLWAASDIHAATAWATTLEDADRTLVATAIVGQVGQADHAGALEIGLALQTGLADGSLEHRAQIWTEEDPAAAVAWLRRQPPGPVRDRLAARVAYARATTDPAEAIRLAEELLPPGLARDAALADVQRVTGRK